MSLANQALLFSAAGSLVGGVPHLQAFIPNFYQAKDSPLLQTLTDLACRAARLKTEREVLAKELLETEHELGILLLISDDPPSNDPPIEPSVQERVAKVAKAVRETDAVLLAYEGFRTVWTTTPGPNAQGEEKPAVTPTTAPAAKSVDSMEPSKLAQALMQETIERLEVTHLLCISQFSGGGESTIRERFSVLPDREGFMGGAAVGYVLAGTDGRILAADTLAQFGIIGGTIKEMTEGRDFEDIDYKPDYPGGTYLND